MKKYRYLLTISSFVLIFFLVACAPINSLPEYSYKYQRIDDLVYDSDMKVDGILDEVYYQNNQFMSFSKLGVEVNVTTHFGEMGLYVGIKVFDEMIFYSTDYDMNSNSSFELKVTREDVVRNNTDVLHLQVDTRNKRPHQYFLFLASTTVQGEPVNSGASDGMTSEIFIPWEQLGINSKPERIKLMPGYNHVTSYGADVGSNWIRPSGNVNNPHTFYYFNENGYINADSEKAVLGDGATGVSKTNGWDLTKLAEQSEVKSNENNAQFIFFKNALSAKYQIETTVYPIDDINDPLPKAGLMIGYNDTAKSGFLIDVRDDYRNQNRLSVKVIDFFQTWNASDYVYTSYDFDFSAGIRLKVIKDEATFYYYVNDLLVYINEIPYLQGEALPGLFSLGAEVRYTDFRYTDYSSQEAELSEILSESSYRLEINTTAGGVVEANKPAIIKAINDKMLLDNKVTLSIEPSIEFKLTKFMIKTGDAEMINLLPTLETSLNNGKYTFEVKDDTVVFVEFTRLLSDQLTEVTGTITNEDASLRPTNTKLTVIGKDNKTLIYYPVLRYLAASKEAVYTVKLPEGKYYFRFMLEGHLTKTVEVDVQGTKIETGKIHLKIRELGGEVNGITDGKEWTLKSTPDWDYSREEEGIIEANSTGNIFFNNQLSSRFMLTAKISDVSSINNYDLKAGLIVAGYYQNGIYVRYCVMIDERADSSKSYIALLKITSSHQWTNHSYESSINITGEGNELTVVRDGKNIIVFLDDSYFTTFTIDYDQQAAFGFQTIGSTAVFSDYTYSYDENVISELLNPILQ